MSRKAIYTAYAGAGLGTLAGLALFVIPVLTYLANMNSSQYAAMVLLPAPLGLYILIWGIVGLVGAKLLRKNPEIGLTLLIVSIIGGSLLGFSLIIWGIPALIEIVAVIMAWRYTSKKKTLPPFQSVM